MHTTGGLAQERLVGNLMSIKATGTKNRLNEALDLLQSWRGFSAGRMDGWEHCTFAQLSLAEQLNQDVLITSVHEENCTTDPAHITIWLLQHNSCICRETEDQFVQWDTTSSSQPTWCLCCCYCCCCLLYWCPWIQRRAWSWAQRRREAQGWGSACSWTAPFPGKTRK